MSGSTLGKRAIAGISSLAAASAAWTARSIDNRSTPGIDATGCRALLPSITNSGHIKSLTETVFSRTRLRDHAFLRARRRRVAGNPGVSLDGCS